MNVKRTAAYLDMSVYALYRRVHERSIPFVKQIRSVRFDRHEIDRWMASHLQPTIERSKDF